MVLGKYSQLTHVNIWPFIQSFYILTWMEKITIALYVITTSSALIFLKLSTAAGGAPLQYLENKLHFNINPLTVLGVGLYGASFLIYTYLITKFDLGYIVPLTTGFVYILIFAASYIIFKEVFTATKIAGISLILCGIILLNITR